MSTIKKIGLGRGLGSLIPQVSTKSQPSIRENSAQEVIHQIPLEQIQANPFQPRKEFSQEDLEDLASSIKLYGVLTPVIVSQIGPDTYELIAGERRLRASKLVGLSVIPAIVKTTKEVEKLEIALIENIQREDLNAMEKAHGYHYLMTQFGLSLTELSARLGMKPPTIANIIRLLSLPQEIQDAILERKITLGHAKYIMEGKTEDEKMEIFKTVIENKLNIPETGILAKKVTKKKFQSHKARYQDPEIDEMRRILEEKLGSKVHINIVQKRKHKADKDISGNIQVEFYSREDLRGLVHKIEQE